MSHRVLFVGLICIAVAALVGIALRFAPTSLPSDAAMQTPPPALHEQVVTPAAATAKLPAGFVQYTSAAYHFSLAYPKDLTVTEHTEQGGAMTITYEDVAGDQSFQIFIVPYGGTQIDTARFKLDEPSGVMDGPTDVLIDGTTATMFFGRNSIMGDTREVWFIRGGFLYEVTTYKELDTWLAQIMATWKWQ